VKGRVYRLVLEPFYNQFLKYQPPEMERSSLELSVLRVKRLASYGPPKELLDLTLDPPNQSDIHNAVLHLKHVGALTVKMHISEKQKQSNEGQASSAKGGSTSSKLSILNEYNPKEYYYDDDNGDLTRIGKRKWILIAN
jgi:hypothetical protein